MDLDIKCNQLGIATALIFTNSWNPDRPPSLPYPDDLVPPKGRQKLGIKGALIASDPVSTSSAIRSARSSFFEKIAPPSPYSIAFESSIA